VQPASGSIAGEADPVGALEPDHSSHPDFSAVIVLICRPTLEATLQSTRPRPIVVLLDNSLSMALSDPRSQAADKLRVALVSQLVPTTQPIMPARR